MSSGITAGAEVFIGPLDPNGVSDGDPSDITSFAVAESHANLVAFLSHIEGGVYRGPSTIPYLTFFSDTVSMEYRRLLGEQLVSLGSLEDCQGDMELSSCRSLSSLGRLRSVGGFLALASSSLVSLGELSSVAGILYLEYCPSLVSLGVLKFVGTLSLGSCDALSSFGTLPVSYSPSLEILLGGVRAHPRVVLALFSASNSPIANLPLLLGQHPFVDRMVRNRLEASS
jgi:hypothetical protein